jgi:hypothetical protein
MVTAQTIILISKCDGIGNVIVIFVLCGLAFGCGA